MFALRLCLGALVSAQGVCVCVWMPGEAVALRAWDARDRADAGDTPTGVSSHVSMMMMSCVTNMCVRCTSSRLDRLASSGPPVLVELDLPLDPPSTAARLAAAGARYMPPARRKQAAAAPGNPKRNIARQVVVLPYSAAMRANEYFCGPMANRTPGRQNCSAACARSDPCTTITSWSQSPDGSLIERQLRVACGLNRCCCCSNRRRDRRPRRAA